MRARALPVATLVLGLTVLAIWRASCVLAGPDIDTDAYAHHMIARAILADPRDLSVHWVWLPLFHYAQVPLVAMGGTMQWVRWLNVLLAAAVPVVLYVYLRSTSVSATSRTTREGTALLAALFAAACPIVMQMGTTAQPEPLFALLVLGVAIAFQRGKDGWTAALLGAAVLLRYEAWACLGVVACFVALRGRGWITVLVPTALIFAWAILRRPVDGSWFAFLGQTKEFANDATHSRFGLVRDLFYYPVLTAVRVLGPVVGLAVFGVVRTWRQQGARFVLVLAACLGFVSLTWMTRSSLGLDRHFVCIVPLYATFAAQGAAVIADAVARWSRRPLTGRVVGGLTALACLGSLFVQLDVWMGFWRASIVRGWPERAALGAYLSELPGSDTIFCDDATLEILSGVDRRRFDRHWIDDPHTWDLIESRAHAERTVYVATWRRRLVGHESEGTIAFRAGYDAADPSRTGVAVLRVER